MEPTYGDYDRDSVRGIDALRSALRDIHECDEYQEVVEKVAELFMNGHEGSSGYLSFGNNKIAKNVAIFNMNSATDCPNADTKACQVPWSDCYAHKAENQYDAPLASRRRQEYLWDCLDSETFARAFVRVIERKNNTVDAIRFSEAGDFRHDGDIIKVNNIAKMLEKHDIDVYTYSASYQLSWNEATHFTVNQSNDFADYGDRLFTAVQSDEELPENMVWCAYDVSDGEHKCGDCKLCINDEGPDVAVELH